MYDLNLKILLDHLFGLVLDTVAVISIFETLSILLNVRQIRTLCVFSRILLLLHFLFSTLQKINIFIFYIYLIFKFFFLIYNPSIEKLWLFSYCLQLCYAVFQAASRGLISMYLISLFNCVFLRILLSV